MIQYETSRYYETVLEIARRLLLDPKEGEDRHRHQINTRLYNNAFCGMILSGVPVTTTNIDGVSFLILEQQGIQYQCPESTAQRIFQKSYDTIIERVMTPADNGGEIYSKTAQEDIDPHVSEAMPQSEEENAMPVTQHQPNAEVMIPGVVGDASTEAPNQVPIKSEKKDEIPEASLSDTNHQTHQPLSLYNAPQEISTNETETSDTPVKDQETSKSEEAHDNHAVTLQPDDADTQKSSELERVNAMMAGFAAFTDISVPKRKNVAEIIPDISESSTENKKEDSVDDEIKGKSTAINKDTDEAPVNAHVEPKGIENDAANDSESHTEVELPVKEDASSDAAAENIQSEADNQSHDVEEDVADPLDDKDKAEELVSESHEAAASTEENAVDELKSSHEHTHGFRPKHLKQAVTKENDVKEQEVETPVQQIQQSTSEDERVDKSVGPKEETEQEQPKKLGGLFGFLKRAQKSPKSSQQEETELPVQSGTPTDEQQEETSTSYIVHGFRAKERDESIEETSVEPSPNLEAEGNMSLSNQQSETESDTQKQDYLMDGGPLFQQVHIVTLNKKFAANATTGPYRFIFWPTWIIDNFAGHTFADVLVHITDPNGNETLLATDAQAKNMTFIHDGLQFNLYGVWDAGVFTSYVTLSGKSDSIFDLHDSVTKQEPEGPCTNAFLDQFRYEAKGKPKHFIVPFKNNNRGEANIPIVGYVEVNRKRTLLERCENNTLIYRYNGLKHVIQGHWEDGHFVFQVQSVNPLQNVIE